MARNTGRSTRSKKKSSSGTVQSRTGSTSARRSSGSTRSTGKAAGSNGGSGFLVQGTILAAASFISRIIGLIYRIPMTNIIGDAGNNYYSAAYDIYNIFLMISSFSLPLAISKLVSARMAKNEEASARRVLRGGLIFACITGGISFFIVFTFADLLTSVLVTPQSYLALRILGPTLLIVAIMGVIRGYFQGMGTMVPSAVSQIIEQIVNAVVSVAAAYALFQYGTKVGAIMGDETQYAQSYGAAGGTLGTSMGALAGLIFLFFLLLFVGHRFTPKAKAQEKSGQAEDYADIFRSLIWTVLPILISTTIYNCDYMIEHIIFKNIAAFQGYAAEDVSTWWGIFSGKYILLRNVPIAIASAVASSAVPSITRAIRQNDRKLVRSKIYSSMRFIMILAFPCAVGMAVLASPILVMLFGDARQLGAIMLQVGALSIIFYSISTLSNGILQGIDRLSVPIKNAVIAHILHIALMLILMLGFHLGIYAVIISNMAFGFFMCVLNGKSIARYAKYRQEFRKTFFMPAIASLIMGVFVWLGYKLFMLIGLGNTIATLVSICLGVIVYLFAVLKLRVVTIRELRTFPKGDSIIRLLRRLHLIQKPKRRKRR